MLKLMQAALVGAATLVPCPAPAGEAGISDGVVRIGVLTDMSGPFSQNTGAGSVEAARMAVDDYGGKVRGKPVEVVFADHQNKPDIGSGRAREWFDRDGVDAVFDLVNSSVALAVMKVAREKNRITVVLGSGSTRITGEDCTATGAQWTYNSYATANAAARALIAEGRDTWFFITADYAFGHSTERDATAVIEAAGGKVVGAVRHPVNTTDFASYLLQAQASGAQVVVLANAAADTVNAVKQAAEFGLTGRQSLLGLAMVINDVDAIGLPSAQGMYLTEGFYWDQSQTARDFGRRFLAKMNKMPNMAHAAAYSAVTHYLKAIDALGTDEAGAVMARMKATPVNDLFTSNGTLRPDGLMVHDMYLFQVKAPAESKYPWDDLVVRRKVAGEEAYGPLSASRCPLLKP